MQRDWELSAIQFGSLGLRLLPQRLRICRLSNLFRNVAVGIGTILLAVACYSPNIAPGGFACGDGGACPDKFHCASDNRCYQAGASMDMAPVCNSTTTVQPTCMKAAASGQCNPICQTGCNNCGWCAVVGGAAMCVTGTAGEKDVGTICDPSKTSECLPGLYCQPETCGSVSTGSCYRICDPADTKSGVNSICGAMSACNVAAKKSGGVTPPFMLCSPICDPLSPSNMNCQAPFGCYPSGATTTECDCAGTAVVGDQCKLAEACAPGETCVGQMGSATCRAICTATVACTSGTCSIPMGALSGTCL
jgi:hypothetical protein